MAKKPVGRTKTQRGARKKAEAERQKLLRAKRVAVAKFRKVRLAFERPKKHIRKAAALNSTKNTEGAENAVSDPWASRAAAAMVLAATAGPLQESCKSTVGTEVESEAKVETESESESKVEAEDGTDVETGGESDSEMDGKPWAEWRKEVWG
jgi:hypothetical protein